MKAVLSEQQMKLNDLIRNSDTVKKLTMDSFWNFMVAGYYLKKIRNEEQYTAAGYKSLSEYAKDEFGFSASSTTRFIQMNDKFSIGGNSELIDPKYEKFGKSQIQEMLYLEDNLLAKVEPDMTVSEIRKMRKPEVEEFEPEPEQVNNIMNQLTQRPEKDIPGQITIENLEDGKYMPEAVQVTEPLSSYGLKKTVYPDGSNLSLKGCGHKYTCDSCSSECSIRQEPRVCIFSPTIENKPCTTINALEAIKQDIGDKCQFVNHDIAYHRAGDGVASPCCSKCEDNNICGFCCNNALRRTCNNENLKTEETLNEVIDAEYQDLSQNEETVDAYSILCDLLEFENNIYHQMMNMKDCRLKTITKQRVKVEALEEYKKSYNKDDTEVITQEERNDIILSLTNMKMRDDWIGDDTQIRYWQQVSDFPELNCSFYKFELPDGSKIIRMVREPQKGDRYKISRHVFYLVEKNTTPTLEYQTTKTYISDKLKDMCKWLKENKGGETDGSD